MSISKPTKTALILVTVLCLMLAMVVNIYRADAQVSIEIAGTPTPATSRQAPQVFEEGFDYTPKYALLATGKPSAALRLAQYDWPCEIESIGHTIASYQNYGGSPYFHHGLDFRANAGTAIVTPSGGQVVNIERYGSSDLYWEVAILDPEGYLWQFHHIDHDTIPQAIYDAYNSGEPVSPGTYIGDIVYWPTVTFGEHFHHIHLNILGDGGVYLNPLAFLTPLDDYQAPEIQDVGLLVDGNVYSGSEVSGEYSLYVHARDLIMHNQFYVPPYDITFSVDGGQETTLWRFDDLPGGSSTTDYIHNFYVPSVTCGNYSCRDFYIDLGFTKSGGRAFPSTSGEHTISVTVRDFVGNVDSQVYSWTVSGDSTPTPTPTLTGTPPTPTPTSEPGIIFSDDFESDQGWIVNPQGNDTARSGMWERANPEGTNFDGPKQLDVTVSGEYALVTGALAGNSASSYDVDDGVTTIRSPDIALPSSGEITLSFQYYLAHARDSFKQDGLRVMVVGAATSTILEEEGGREDDDAAWEGFSASLNAFAGQTIYLLIEGTDAARESLVEAAIDDVLITGSGGPTPTPTNTPPPTGTPTNTPTPTDTPTATLTPTPGDRVFEDNFETDKGWTAAGGTATTGQFERAIPQTTSYSNVDYQIAAASPDYDLVTGASAGSGVGSYDIDGGDTAFRSPDIALPNESGLTLTFNYYLAHYSNATSDDYLRVSVVGATTETVLEVLGTGSIKGAAWQSFSADLSAFAGQTVYLLVEAADGGSGSLVEAAIDDVLIE